MRLDRLVSKRVLAAAVAVAAIALVLASRHSREPSAGAALPADNAPATAARSVERAADRMPLPATEATHAVPPPTSSETLGAQLRRLAGAWAQTETDEARAALLERFSASLDVAFVQDALSRLAALPEEMAGLLQRALFGRLAELDPAAAIARAETLPPGTLQRREVQLAIALRWAETNLPAVIAWVARWPEESASRDVAVQGLRALFGEAKPEEMVDLGDIVAALPRGQMKSDLLDGLTQRWGESDFNAALAWAQTLPEASGQERALLHLSYAWEKLDRSQALAFAENLPAGQDALAVALAARWARTEPEAAAKWAAALPDDTRRDKALSSLAAVWAQQDPRAAGEFLLRLPASAGQHNAAISILSAWAAKEPAVAAQWAEGFPAGQVRDYAIENVAYRWAQDDPAAAAGWLARLPPGSERDTAGYAGAASLIGSRPELAARWAEAIGDNSRRTLQMERVARAWLRADAPAARLWLVQTTLPDALKHELLTPPLQ